MIKVDSGLSSFQVTKSTQRNKLTDFSWLMMRKSTGPYSKLTASSLKSPQECGEFKKSLSACFYMNALFELSMATFEFGPEKQHQ